MAASDGKEKVIATAEHIVKTLRNTDIMTDDMRHIFSKFDRRLSGMAGKYKETYSAESLEEALDFAEAKIMRWDMENSEFAGERTIWAGGPEEISLYLEAVDDVQNMIEALSVAPDDEKDFSSLDRAQSILHLAMVRLGEEFRMVLQMNGNFIYSEWGFDPSSQRSPSSSNWDDRGSQISAEDEGEEDVVDAQPVDDLNFIIDTVPSQIVLHLNDIAKRMVGAGYMEECCRVYSSTRRAFLEESVLRLVSVKRSIEEIQKMEWEVLEVEISKWIQAFKISVMVFFPSERKLCERVFAGVPPVSERCFADLARGIMIQLLNFAKTIAIGRRSPERLFKFLDIYETLQDLLPEINVVFSGEACSELKSEACGIWLQLGEAARGTFVEFENAIQRDTAKNPELGGAVHPLTRYVMNYMRFACDYKQTLERILEYDRGEDARVPGSALNCSGDFSSEHAKSRGDDDLSPFAIQTMWIMELLKRNLDAKSMLYKDPALSCLFLMNNGQYIVQKAKDSEIGNLLGDDWVQKHSAKVQQYHNNYQRTAWSNALACLNDEGSWISGNFSGGVSRAVLKDRLHSFNTLFEEIHKTQQAWIVADNRLRNEVRISIAEMVIPVYRSFVTRFEHFLVNGKHSEKRIKYRPEDLVTYINELFEGTSVSDPTNRRRSFPNT